MLRGENVGEETPEIQVTKDLLTAVPGYHGRNSLSPLKEIMKGSLTTPSTGIVM